MRVGLFVPCFVDQLWPEVGFAALALLEHAGATVEFPTDQTCCGQALHSVGGHDDARALALRMARVFDGYDAVVAPSGSCAAMLRVHYPALLGGGPEAHAFAARCHELCDFLHGVLRVPAPTHAFAHRVALHAGCHALRELRLGRPSEGGSAGEDPARALLSKLAGIELVPLARDECCGFGGAFCVEEPAVSCRMGLDRLEDHAAARAEVLTSSDPSCLLHLGALARRHGQKLRVLHVAQILANAVPA